LHVTQATARKDKASKIYSAKCILAGSYDTREHPDVFYAKWVGGELGALEDGFMGCPSYKAWICTAVGGSIAKGVN
jgi:hypothetical protein